MNKENKLAAMIPPTLFVTVSISNPFDQSYCCNTSSLGTRQIQWDWSGDDMVTDIKLHAHVLGPTHWF